MYLYYKHIAEDKKRYFPRAHAIVSNRRRAVVSNLTTTGADINFDFSRNYPYNAAFQHFGYYYLILTEETPSVPIRFIITF